MAQALAPTGGLGDRSDLQSRSIDMSSDMSSNKILLKFCNSSISHIKPEGAERAGRPVVTETNNTPHHFALSTGWQRRQFHDWSVVSGQLLKNAT